MKKHQALIPADALPGGAERLAQVRAAEAELARAGYVAIGLDHFARPDDPLALALSAGRLHRNFQGYTTDAAPALIGLGASSIGFLPQGYVQNSPNLKLYREAIERGRFAIARGFALSDEDRIRRSIIERLMCDLAVNLANHATDARTDFAHELAQLSDLAADGLVTVQGTEITVPETMRPFVRKVASVFDTHLQGAEKRAFARGVSERQPVQFPLLVRERYHRLRHGSSLRHYRYRAARMVDDGFRDAAKQPRGQSAEAAPADHDQIDLLGFGKGDNCLAQITITRKRLDVCDAAPSRTLRRAVEDFLDQGMPRRSKIAFGAREAARVPPPAARGRWLRSSTCSHSLPRSSPPPFRRERRLPNHPWQPVCPCSMKCACGSPGIGTESTLPCGCAPSCRR